MNPAVKRRNMILQVLWMVLTLGMYMFYWFYVTTREMSETLKRNDEVTLWTVLFGLPLLQFYPMYKQAEVYEIFSGKAVDRWIIFMLWVFFPPGVWFIIQRRLNDVAEGKTKLPTEPGSPLLA